jgi:hypothetical protein
VQAVNGRAMVSAEAAFEAFVDYIYGGELRLTITRRNAPVELVLHPEPG